MPAMSVSPTLRPIEAVASDLGLSADDISVHGHYRARVHLDLPQSDRRGRYVLLTASTPTASGSGKTVSAIGLGMGLRQLGHRSVVTLRESAVGPTFGMKGGGAGGGAAQVLPLEECLLRLTDTPAVTAAHNLLAAVVDDALHRGTGIDPAAITWRRVLDVDDRALRHIVVGLGGAANGPSRETGFDITASSEVMALLALSRDPADLRDRLNALVVGWDREGKPVTAGGLGAAGAMAVLLSDSLQPNLMQSSEGTPVVVHTGPFGNLAAGNSSVIGDRLLLPRTDYLVTEAGFAADLGAEKFFDIKCRASGLEPDAVVLVTNVPSLRAHGGGEPREPDVAAVAAGCANLRHHVRVLLRYGRPVVVAINTFPDDQPDETAVVVEAALGAGAVAAVPHHAFTRGGAGCEDLAAAVVGACDDAPTTPITPVYALEASYEDKVHAIATGVYGAADVAWSASARRDLSRFVNAGYNGLPVCMAKTPLSLSHDPTLLGAPTGFTLPVQSVRLAAGAGYLTVLTGDIMTMPGLPAHPRLLDMDVDASGAIVGLV